MHVPSLKKNLVSVAMLEDRGYDMIFSKGKAFLHHIALGQVKHIKVWVKNLYKLDAEDCTALSMKVEKVQSRDITDLWHKRLGHLHHGALKIVQQISMGLPKGKLEKRDTCKMCTLGNYNKDSFHDKYNRSQVILDRGHSNVCGLFSITSETKKRYYVIFVHDFSRKLYIFFIHTKDKMFTKVFWI